MSVEPAPHRYSQDSGQKIASNGGSGLDEEELDRRRRSSPIARMKM
jgi:hypothetical protein